MKARLNFQLGKHHHSVRKEGRQEGMEERKEGKGSTPLSLDFLGSVLPRRRYHWMFEPKGVEDSRVGPHVGLLGGGTHRECF